MCKKLSYILQQRYKKIFFSTKKIEKNFKNDKINITENKKYTIVAIEAKRSAQTLSNKRFLANASYSVPGFP